MGACQVGQLDAEVNALEAQAGVGGKDEAKPDAGFIEPWGFFVRDSVKIGQISIFRAKPAWPLVSSSQAPHNGMAGAFLRFSVRTEPT